MRLTDIIKDANSNLLRSKARTILTIIAIFIGAFTLTVTNGIGSGVSKYIDQQLGNLGAEDVLIVQQQVDDPFGSGPKKYEEGSLSSNAFAGGPTLPLLRDEDIKKITSVSGIQGADPFLNIVADYIIGPNFEKYTVTISAYITGTNLGLLSGELPDNGSADLQIIIPHNYVPVLGFNSPDAAVGKKIALAITSALGEQGTVDATVVGVQENSLLSINGASVNDSLLRNLFAVQSEGKPATAQDGYAAVVARVGTDISPGEMERIKNELKDKGYAAQTFQDQIGVFKQVIGAIITVLNFFAVIALLAASFGIVNTLLMAVQERTKEIGLMKAMGLSRGKIFLLFSIEAVLLGFWGSLLGSLAGIGVGKVANQIATNTFLKDLPGFSLTSFSPFSVLTIMLIIMAISFIAGTLPARRASRKDPIEALRYE